MIHYNTAKFGAGQRVALLPHLDLWMQGERYGTVAKVGRTYVHVKLDKSGLTRGIGPQHLEIQS